MSRRIMIDAIELLDWIDDMKQAIRENSPFEQDYRITGINFVENRINMMIATVIRSEEDSEDEED